MGIGPAAPGRDPMTLSVQNLIADQEAHDAEQRAKAKGLSKHAQLRCILLEKNERVRIARNGEVHVYGTMPNTNTIGWYLVGFDSNLIDQYEFEGLIF